MAVCRTGGLALGLLLAACGRVPTQAVPPGAAKADPPPTTGTLEVRVTDALDGKPIQRCCVVGWDLTQVTPSGDKVALDGLHRFVVPPNIRRVRLAAAGYSETWSGNAGVAAGRTRALAVSMNPLSHLVVRVMRTDGMPVPDGAILLMGPDHHETMGIKNGLADKPVDAGTVDVLVDPDFLPGFTPQRKRVTLKPGQRTELTLEVAPRK